MTLSNKEGSSDPIKILAEWALSAGRHFQSKQTGFVHLYNAEADPGAQTIPLLENFLFVLALFRTHVVEQVQEGKKLLKGLLAFQNKDSKENIGNFPVYLHEFPVCNDKALALLILAPMYWIIKQYGHILGSELKKELQETSVKALQHCIRMHQEKPFPFSLAVRVAAAKHAFGLLWSDEMLVRTGEEELLSLAKQQIDGWQTTRQVADLLVALQMVYSKISESPWSLLWEQINQTWHSNLATYIGPCVREWQEGLEPQGNLFDLFGGYYGGQFSGHASRLNPFHLHGILIQVSSEKFDEARFPSSLTGVLKDQAWLLNCEKNWAYTLLEKKGSFQPTVDKTHTPFRLVWGDGGPIHSLVCQGGNIEQMEFRQEEQKLILDFDLRELASEEQSAPKNEIEFFIDHHPEYRFRISGEAANTFELDKEIEIDLKQIKFFIKFELLEGEGTFFGHVMRGNRPSQTDLKGEKRFFSYDWTFFLRSIRRKGKCKMRAEITMLPQT